MLRVELTEMRLLLLLLLRGTDFLVGRGLLWSCDCRRRELAGVPSSEMTQVSVKRDDVIGRVRLLCDPNP